MKFREKMARFMAGRYGVDQLNQALLWIYLALAILSLFFRPLYLLTFLIIFWLFFRILSKNIYKRQLENQKYLRITGKIKGWFKLQKRKFTERKTHAFRKCPHCKATLRLPRKKGSHTVCCPHCKKDFSVKI